MGVDLHVADLLDQIVHYGGSPAGSFVFLLDAATGLSVYHPGGLRDFLITPGGGGAAGAFRRPSTPTTASAAAATEEAFHHFQEPLLHVDVRRLERTPGFDDFVLPRILNGEINGTVDFIVEIVGFYFLVLSF